MTAPRTARRPHLAHGAIDADLDVDVAVVGGGVAGVVAAAEAARAGARVVLLEARGHLGGRADTVERDGFRLNSGPHALYAAGAAKQAADRLGLGLGGHRPPLEDARGRLGDALHALPTGPRSLLASKLLGPRSKAQFGRLFGAMAAGKLAPAETDTVGRWLDSLTDRDDVRALLAALVRLSTYSNAEDTFSATAAAAQLRAGNDGVLYLDGGWQDLVEGIAGAAVEHGATLHTDSGVQVLAPLALPDGDGWALYTAEHAVTASAVILAVPPAVAGRLLSTAGDGVHPPIYGDLGPAVTAACLDLGTAAPAPTRFCLGIDRPLYLSPHTPPANLAPVGAALVSIAAYLAADDDRAPAGIEAELVEHAQCCGVDVDGALLRRYLHRMVVTQAMPLAVRGGLAGRPPVTVPDHLGVFVAGDWVGPEGLLADASAASGTAAAGQAVALTARRARHHGTRTSALG